MTTKTRTTHWGLLFAAGLLAVCGLAGCGNGPTGPSQTAQSAPTSPAQPTNAAPIILSVTPSIGSTSGGAHVKVTGAGLESGTRVTFGATIAYAFFDKFSGAIFVTAPSYAPGTVDVLVTNVDGQTAVASGAYTFADPESFNVDGDWRGVSFAGEDDEPFGFTVVNGAIVTVTCATSGLVRLSPPAPIIRGGFSFGGEDGVAISGRILAPNEAMGRINVDPAGSVRPCVGAEWHANKD